VPAAQTAPASAAPLAAAKQNGLFNLDDSAMDELFMKNLGVTEGPPGPATATPAFLAAPVPNQPPANPFMKSPPPQAPGAQAQPANPFAPLANPQAAQMPPQQMPQGAPQPAWGAPQPAPAPQPQPQQQPQQQQGGPGLFSIDDSMIDRIFSDEAPPQPVGAPPKFNVGKVNEAVREIAQAVPLVPVTKIDGIGKLDTKAESTDNVGGGRIASIGKFLLDQKDLEKIGKLTNSDLSESKMRILTTDAAQELQNLLHHIGAQKTVLGSVIVGHDGLLIANTMPNDLDAESIGVWALGIYMNTENVLRKMGQERVYQIVARTIKGYVVIADFGGGLLVTVSDGKDTDALIPLMRAITQLVAQ
jgi:predicted regulator of Ras-like GTPase activity (Roadblock/LC7/MglB family)